MVTDMPFGKKSGSRQLNWTLYPKALTEMARVCPPQTGRVVLLTHDKKVMKKTLHQTSQWWKMKQTLWINMGGLQAGVYVLTRTEKCFSEDNTSV
jgi:23S rRNA G2445 N2-methylase RlmL